MGEATAEYRKAIELDPGNSAAHYNLGRVFQETNLLDEATAEYRKAIDFDPKNAVAHYDLGLALHRTNQLDEAIAEYRKAIDVDYMYTHARNNLGGALLAKNRLDEAIAEYRKAIDVDPKYAVTHANLGLALCHKNQLDEAIAECRKAIELDPKYPAPHNTLGVALYRNNQFDEAIPEFRRAIDLDPKSAEAHDNLGNALLATNQLEKAIGEYRKAVELDPKLMSAQRVVNAERLVGLEAKLVDVLAGKATVTDNGERLGLLEVCRLQRRHVAAARLYADAFTAEEKLAEDLKAGHRYNAGCFAVLAAAGQGIGADKLDAKEETRLRGQALAWLRADLEQWSKRVEGGRPEDRRAARAALEHWQCDTDLAGVREADALKKLSAQEQESWRKLWADVAEVLTKTGNAK